VTIRGREIVAGDVLQCAMSWEPNVCLIGNVTAEEIAALAAAALTVCPKCGSEAWVNIDCDLCRVCTELLRENRG
jgi:hypothetical protein